MNRNDLQGSPCEVPKSIRDYLLKKGGRNIFNEPLFRLVWSPSRFTKKGGRFEEWDSSIPAHLRGGVMQTEGGVLVPNGYRPTRIVVEVRDVRKYLFDAGWVLERWVPASFYGARGDWDAMTFTDGLTTVPRLGPYPSTGDYEMCHNSASVALPSISTLATAIEASNQTRENHRQCIAQMMLERHNRYQAEDEAERKKEREETEAFYRDLMSPIFSSSLQAGRWRGEVARSIGLTEHVGN